MGVLRSWARNKGKEFRKQVRSSKYLNLAQEVQRLHAHTPMADWQRSRVAEIRALYEDKRQKLGEKHDVLQAELAREFMQHEVDFITASHEFRKKNPDEVWAPTAIGKMGFMAKRFWNQLIERGRSLGISYGEANKA